jgi:hypothetical protein
VRHGRDVHRQFEQIHEQRRLAGLLSVQSPGAAHEPEGELLGDAVAESFFSRLQKERSRRLSSVNERAARVIWFWVAIELVNGVGHPLWSLRQGGYTPGVATAPLLFVLALVVATQVTARLPSDQREDL